MAPTATVVRSPHFVSFQTNPQQHHPFAAFMQQFKIPPRNAGQNGNPAVVPPEDK